MEWVIENKAWLFSGIAIAIPIALIGWIVSKSTNRQVQRSGDNSTNIQIGGDFKIKTSKKDE